MSGVPTIEKKTCACPAAEGPSFSVRLGLCIGLEVGTRCIVVNIDRSGQPACRLLWDVRCVYMPWMLWLYTYGVVGEQYYDELTYNLRTFVRSFLLSPYASSSILARVRTTYRADADLKLDADMHVPSTLVLLNKLLTVLKLPASNVRISDERTNGKTQDIPPAEML
jgi:hypothetical protein